MTVVLTGDGCISQFLSRNEVIESISCCGVIKSKRNLKKLVFFMLEIDGHLGADKGAEDEVDDQIQLVLDLSQVDAESTSLRDSAQHIRVGAVVRCVGVPKSDRPGSLSVYLQTVDIIRCSPEPDAIMRFLADEAADGAMIVCKVLDCNLTDYQELKTLAAGGPSKAKQLKQAVAKHSRTMMGKPSRRSRQREHRVSRADQDILEKLEAETHMWPIDSGLLPGAQCLDEEGGGEDATSEHREQVDDSDALLNIPGQASAPSSRGPMSRGEYMHGRKKPQIRWLVRKLSTMGTFLHVLDIGGGRGDLAVLIAQTFPHAYVTVVDANLSSLRQGKLFARKCGEHVYRRIIFICARFVVNFSFEGAHVLSDADLDDTATPERAAVATTPATSEAAVTPITAPAIDVVVALHACGGLSDLALHYAATHLCKFLICPCCYLKTPYCMPSSPSAPVVPLTVETATSEDAYTERLALLRLAESDSRACSLRASHIVNSQRLTALDTILKNSPGVEKDAWKLQLSEFSKDYSLRNLVLSSTLT